MYLTYLIIYIFLQWGVLKLKRLKKIIINLNIQCNNKISRLKKIAGDMLTQEEIDALLNGVNTQNNKIDKRKIDLRYGKYLYTLNDAATNNKIVFYYNPKNAKFSVINTDLQVAKEYEVEGEKLVPQVVKTFENIVGQFKMQLSKGHYEKQDEYDKAIDKLTKFEDQLTKKRAKEDAQDNKNNDSDTNADENTEDDSLIDANNAPGIFLYTLSETDLINIYYNVDEKNFYISERDNDKQKYTKFDESSLTSNILTENFQEIINILSSNIDQNNINHNQSDYDKAIDMLEQIDADPQNFKKNNDTKKKDNQKKKKSKEKVIKTVQFYFPESKKDIVEQLINNLSINNLIHSYNLALAPKNTNQPSATHYSRLKRKIIAYNISLAFANAINVIQDFNDYNNGGGLISLYMTNQDDQGDGDSCEGFIIVNNNDYIAFGKDFITEITLAGSDTNSNGQPIAYNDLPSFINDLITLKNQGYNLSSIKSFHDFNTAERFILDNNANIKSKISKNEVLAGKSEIYGEQSNSNEQPTDALWVARIHYDANDDEKIQAIKDWLMSVYDEVIQPYNSEETLNLGGT